jgi:Ser/Thr protein kinase RdoA (MazF antagonist)
MHSLDQHARRALLNYSMQPIRVTLLQSDRQRVFKVTERRNASYVLRIYGPNDPARRFLSSQTRWLAALASETALRVPAPVMNQSGRAVTTFRSNGATFYAALTRWVSGARRFRANGPGARVLLDVGRAMATLHRHGQSFRSKGFRAPRWDYDGLLGRHSPWRPARALTLDHTTRVLFDSIATRARVAMRSLGYGAEVWGLIHGDCIQANYVIDRGRIGLIDFSDFGFGHFLYDIAITLLMLRPFDRTGDQRRAFLAGYREVRELSHAHEELLDTFIAARAVVLARHALGAATPHPGDVEWVRQTLRWLN